MNKKDFMYLTPGLILTINKNTFSVCKDTPSETLSYYRKMNTEIQKGQRVIFLETHSSPNEFPYLVVKISSGRRILVTPDDVKLISDEIPKLIDIKNLANIQSFIELKKGSKVVLPLGFYSSNPLHDGIEQGYLFEVTRIDGENHVFAMNERRYFERLNLHKLKHFSL